MTGRLQELRRELAHWDAVARGNASAASSGYMLAAACVLIDPSDDSLQKQAEQFHAEALNAIDNRRAVAAQIAQLEFSRPRMSRFERLCRRLFR